MKLLHSPSLKLPVYSRMKKKVDQKRYKSLGFPLTLRSFRREYHENQDQSPISILNYPATTATCVWIRWMAAVQATMSVNDWLNPISTHFLSHSSLSYLTHYELTENGHLFFVGFKDFGKAWLSYSFLCTILVGICRHMSVFLDIFFGWQECVDNFFADVAHFVFLIYSMSWFEPREVP